jgi:hypothetical protein
MAVDGIVASDVRRPRIDHGAVDGDRASSAHCRWCTPGRPYGRSGDCSRRNVSGLLGGSAGFLANLLSHPILTGYMAGIAVSMIISQLDTFTGIPIRRGTSSPKSHTYCGIWIRFTFSPLVWPFWCSGC